MIELEQKGLEKRILQHQSKICIPIYLLFDMLHMWFNFWKFGDNNQNSSTFPYETKIIFVAHFAMLGVDPVSSQSTGL